MPDEPNFARQFAEFTEAQNRKFDEVLAARDRKLASIVEERDRRFADNDAKIQTLMGENANLIQKINSFTNILLGGFDLGNRPDDMERVRKVRDGTSYAILMKGREMETERLLQVVRELCEMKQPTFDQITEFVVDLMTMKEPTLEQLLEQSKKSWKFSEPSWDEMNTYVRRGIRAEAEKAKTTMSWLRLFASLVLGGIISYVLFRIQGK